MIIIITIIIIVIIIVVVIVVVIISLLNISICDACKTNRKQLPKPNMIRFFCIWCSKFPGIKKYPDQKTTQPKMDAYPKGKRDRLSKLKLTNPKSQKNMRKMSRSKQKKLKHPGNFTPCPLPCSGILSIAWSSPLCSIELEGWDLYCFGSY